MVLRKTTNISLSVSDAYVSQEDTPSSDKRSWKIDGELGDPVSPGEMVVKIKFVCYFLLQFYE